MSSSAAVVGPNSAVQLSRPEAYMGIAHEVRELISHMLGDGRSTIDPDTTIWTVEAGEDLRARVEDHPIEGKALSQWEKLDVQLDGASRPVVLLAAEIVFLREQPVRASLPKTRREHVERVLAHLDEPVQIPATMSTSLQRSTGVAGFEPGQSYNWSLWRHIIWTSTFIRYWAGLPESERVTARRDPWELQQRMLESGPDQADIRNALQFLAAPEAFEPIAAAQMKKSIRDGLGDRIGALSGDGPAGIDRDLFAIRETLCPEIKGAFNFWDPGVAELWRSNANAVSGAEDDEGVSEALPEPRGVHYWLYSPGNKAYAWDEFSEVGIMGIGWDRVGDLAQFPDREAIRQALDVNNTGKSMSNDVRALWQFQHDMAEGDIVYAKRGRSEIVGRGIVTSGPRFEADRQHLRHVRSVDWTQKGQWPHPGSAALKTLTDITKYHDYVEKLEELVVGDIEDEPETEERTNLPAYNHEAFLREVYLSATGYERLRSLLLRKKNVILAGPPGVGKTFTAKRLAYSLLGAKDPGRVQVVQFHQSYSYEDFMMGYRPTESGGFTLAEGPFYRFCNRAGDDPEHSYFFIIDEINRGNISKIFGELLMLIEADKRGHELRLLYKNETFSVPPNVFIIGMMNTADRSLAVLDYALRWRFGFFEMRPGFSSDGFTAWQSEAGSPTLDRLVETVIALNAAIADDPALGRGFEIGHSFLSCPTDVSVDDSWLSSVVEDELVPLLEEYWFDEATRVQEWSSKLRAALG